METIPFNTADWLKKDGAVEQFLIGKVDKQSDGTYICANLLPGIQYAFVITIGYRYREDSVQFAIGNRSDKEFYRYDPRKGLRADSLDYNPLHYVVRFTHDGHASNNNHPKGWNFKKGRFTLFNKAARLIDNGKEVTMEEVIPQYKKDIEDAITPEFCIYHMNECIKYNMSSSRTLSIMVPELFPEVTAWVTNRK